MRIEPSKQKTKRCRAIILILFSLSVVFFAVTVINGVPWTGLLCIVLICIATNMTVPLRNYEEYIDYSENELIIALYTRNPERFAGKDVKNKVVKSLNARDRYFTGRFPEYKNIKAVGKKLQFETERVSGKKTYPVKIRLNLERFEEEDVEKLRKEIKTKKGTI